MSLLEEMNRKATEQGIPLSAHMDITWKCNERCVHCYLVHEGKNEMSTAEIKDAIRPARRGGNFFLSISGGEPLLRRDCFEILEYARELRFNVKLKTNAVDDRGKEGGEAQAARHRAGADQHLLRPPRDSRRHHQVARIPRRSSPLFERLKAEWSEGLHRNVPMKITSPAEWPCGSLAKEIGVEFRIDPTITPMLNGDRSILNLGITKEELDEVFHTEEFIGDVGEFRAPVANAMKTCSKATVAARAIRSLIFLHPATPFPAWSFHAMRQRAREELPRHLVSLRTTHRAPPRPVKHLRPAPDAATSPIARAPDLTCQALGIPVRASDLAQSAVEGPRMFPSM